MRSDAYAYWYRGDAIGSESTRFFTGPTQRQLLSGLWDTAGRSKFMATSFTHLLVTVGTLAAGYVAAMVAGSAWAGDDLGVLTAAAEDLTELMQWHSGLSVTSSSCVAPELKNAAAAIQAPDTAAFLALHGAPGAWDAPRSGVRKSVWDGPKAHDGSAPRMH